MTENTKDPSGVACNHVMRGKRPLAVIAHDSDGVWQFMCGKDDHTKQKQAKKVSVSKMFAKVVKGITQDEVAEGQIAERSADGWAVRDLSGDEQSQIDDVSTDTLAELRK